VEDEFAPYTSALVSLIDRQISQIGDVLKVSKSSSQSNQELTFPSRDEDIRMFEHGGHDLAILYRTSLT
jgi:hypothetical protein